jgi:hypothetical protein
MAPKKKKPTRETTRFFADTTVVYYRLHSHTLSAKATADAIGDRPVFVSNFVRGEYIRGFVCGLIDLYSAIKEEQSVRDGIHLFISEAGRHPRKLANALLAVPVRIQGHEDWEEVDKSLRRLGEFIRMTLMKFDTQFLHRITDPLRCDHGVHNFRQESFSEDHILDFYQDVENARETPSCDQCEFRAKQPEALHAAGTDLISPAQREKYKNRKGYVQQAKVLDKSTRTRLKTASCHYCDRLGDTIITLSSPADATILTGDHQSFPALAEILGKPIQLIPSLNQLRKESEGKLTANSSRHLILDHIVKAGPPSSPPPRPPPTRTAATCTVRESNPGRRQLRCYSDPVLVRCALYGMLAAARPVVGG